MIFAPKVAKNAKGTRKDAEQPELAAKNAKNAKQNRNDDRSADFENPRLRASPWHASAWIKTICNLPRSRFQRRAVMI